MQTNNAPVQGPVIQVPVDPYLASEPARKIGDIFSDKAMLRTMVSGIATIIAGITGRVIGDDQIAAWVDVIAITGMFVTIYIAQREASERAIEQGEATRAVVYAPDTVERRVSEAARAGEATIEAVPESEWGVNQKPSGISGPVPGGSSGTV